MQKVLRSLIHELIEYELRVELEVLSKRRDISNREKQQELILLLKKYNINDIVQLGSGTNRYAFKLKGFVVKFATDADGKIDNFKEFKMAKRLFPYVIRVHEVSQNGTIMVCEYIQPFVSYSEMIAHQEQIRDILDKLSSVYLIGDVGITDKNFCNWGLRVGTNEPVCLDFAYVYEVKSSLFICDMCKTGSMLVPDKDYTKLICSNPSCQKKYLFEDIRMKIGNDAHNHEIGDLSEEGYLLTQSNTLVTLSAEKSNYLEKKIPDKKKEVVLQKPINTKPKFVMGMK